LEFPNSLSQGQEVRATVYFNVAGLPEGASAPVVVHYTLSGNGKTVSKDWRSQTANGDRSSWYQIGTSGWSPGNYTIGTVIDVVGAKVSSSGTIAIVVPEPEVQPPATPPPDNTPPPDANVDNYLGDWQGTANIVEGFKNMALGQVPVKFRITSENGSYHVYDLLDPSTPAPPMQSRIEGDQLVFYYSGPLIDTQGYAHEEQSEETSWALSSDGTQISGRAITSISNEGRLVLDVSATRAR
jgi:hypothetical protein